MDDNGFRLWERHAILAYLAKRDESIYPSDVKQRARVDQMLSFDARTFQPAVAAFVHPTAFERQMASAAAREALKGPMTQLDAALGSSFVAGSFFSIADIALHCSLSSLELMADGEKILCEYSNVARWYGECKERADCKTANAFFEEWKVEKQSEAQRLCAAQDDANELWLTIIGFVQGVFHAVDTDGNGVLDRQELKAAATKVFAAVMDRTTGGQASRMPAAFA